MLRYSGMPVLIVLLLFPGSSHSRARENYWSKSDCLKPLLEVLSKANVSGSLEFTGSCNSFNFHVFPEFPQLRLPSTSNEPVLQAVREMFADDPAMRITQDPGGALRMVERGTVTDILNVRIHTMPEGSGSAYSAWAALHEILDTTEFKLFMKTHDITLALSGGSVGSFDFSPHKVGPHISRLPDNTTVSQAMDYILQTFPGLWIYENCPKTSTRKRTVYFRFYRLQNTGTGTIVQ